MRGAVGFSVYQDNEATLKRLVEQADAACRRAKLNGGSSAMNGRQMRVPMICKYPRRCSIVSNNDPSGESRLQARFGTSPVRELRVNCTVLLLLKYRGACINLNEAHLLHIKDSAGRLLPQPRKPPRIRDVQSGDDCSPEEFDRLTYRARFLNVVGEGVADANAGRLNQTRFSASCWMTSSGRWLRGVEGRTLTAPRLGCVRARPPPLEGHREDAVQLARLV